MAFYFPLYESSTPNSPMETSTTWKNTFWPTKRITQVKPYRVRLGQSWTPLRKFRLSFRNWRHLTFCSSREATSLSMFSRLWIWKRNAKLRIRPRYIARTCGIQCTVRKKLSISFQFWLDGSIKESNDFYDVLQFNFFLAKFL